MTNYEQVYRQEAAACGTRPFAEVAAFFDALPRARILDVGCGQGRDALYAARGGHTVHGIDLAPTGIAQMLQGAAAEDLEVTGVAADICAHEIDAVYDAVLIDRVLHCLPTEQRVTTLQKRCAR